MSTRMMAGLRGLVLVMAACLPLATMAAPLLLLVNAPYPPFVNQAGDPQGEGMDIEIAREALRRGGYDMEVRLVPRKRALLMLEMGEADFTTTISRNGDRDRYLAWSQGYRKSIGYRFYSRRNAGHSLNELAGLDGKRVGITLGHFYPAVISERPQTIYLTGNTLQMLHAGRSDYIVVCGDTGYCCCEW